MYDEGGYSKLGLPRPTPVVGRLLLLNAIVFALNAVLLGRLSERVDGGGMWFAVGWTELWSGYGLGLLRLLSYQFTHSFQDPMHILWNMLALWCFGGIVEQRLGGRGTWQLYLLGGLAGAVVHMATFAVLEGRSVPVVGASGACYALFLWAVCAAPRLEVTLFVVRVQLLFLGLLFTGLALYSLYVEVAGGGGSGVSHSAHLGGALVGFVAWRARWLAAPTAAAPFRAGLLGRLSAWRAARQRQQAGQRARRQDELLAKVKAAGLQSLTAAERRFLQAESERVRQGR